MRWTREDKGVACSSQSALENRIVVRRVCEICKSFQVSMLKKSHLLGLSVSPSANSTRASVIGEEDEPYPPCPPRSKRVEKCETRYEFQHQLILCIGQ